MREHARLAGAGAGDHEERAVDVENGLALRRIEAVEELLVRRDGHSPMLAIAPNETGDPVTITR